MTATKLPTPPTPKTKKPATATAVAPSDAAGAPQTATVDIAAIRNEAAMMDADLAQQEAQLAQQLRDISERRQNAIRAKALLSQRTTRERREEAARAAQTERATQQAAYDRDVATRQTLLAEAQRLTTELVGVVRAALSVDARIHAASVALGISTQRSGYASRALTNHIGYALNALGGLRDFPLGRTHRTLVGDPQGDPQSDGGAV